MRRGSGARGRLGGGALRPQLACAERNVVRLVPQAVSPRCMWSLAVGKVGQELTNFLLLRGPIPNDPIKQH